MALTVLIEPDPTGHRFQWVSHVVRALQKEGSEVLLLTSTGAPATPAYQTFLGDLPVPTVERFDEIYPPAREVAAALREVHRERPISRYVIMDSDQFVKRWWRRRAEGAPLLRRRAVRHPADDPLPPEHPAEPAAPVPPGGQGLLHRPVHAHGRGPAHGLRGRPRPVPAGVALPAPARPGHLRPRMRASAPSCGNGSDCRSTATSWPSWARSTPASASRSWGRPPSWPGPTSTCSSPAGSPTTCGPGSTAFPQRCGAASTIGTPSSRMRSSTPTPRPATSSPWCSSRPGPSGIMGKAQMAGVPVLSAGSKVRAREAAVLGSGIHTELDAASIAHGLRDLLARGSEPLPIPPDLPTARGVR